MSEYNCFNCNRTEHTFDLVRVEWKGLVSLLCNDCIEKLFVEDLKVNLDKQIENNELDAIEKKAEELQLNEEEEREWEKGDL